MAVAPNAFLQVAWYGFEVPTELFLAETANVDLEYRAWEGEDNKSIELSQRGLEHGCAESVVLVKSF